MKAMIFAAGSGTRLLPLTEHKPKALVEVNGTPMLELIIKKLVGYGFNDIIINVHHYSEQVIDFLKVHHNFNTRITISDETNLLLDTGGGLMKASWFFDDGNPFLIHNTDILSDLDLNALYQAHLNSPALAMLAVKDRPTSRSLLLDEKGFLCGWKSNITGETKISFGTEHEHILSAFSCVQVLSPEFFEHITESGVFSIMDVYLRLAREHLINTFNHNHSYWFDLGTVENLKKAENFLQNNSI
jgi:NDP-sugar pyrophosphorylase family protein